MLNNQKGPIAEVDIPVDQLAIKVNLFMFDLKNEATELGFKAGETWALELVSDIEAKHLKKQHQPVVSLSLQSSALLSAFREVKNKLQQTLTPQDMLLTTNDLNRDEKKYLVAYPVRNTSR
ncbi:hypothetical protein [Mucilaginibacter celer]|uniref:Uncharacterized protein n=1 Tax=Mucilaginibacter celer TaxID=2305508 RepID=A0A494VTV0_9SPHI|nr:hypothetical protein [Mucilaginibacter celer]AYL99006.1 hypothetical protein HYN43_028695 [Mucilaginibacter celer]